MCIRDSIPSYQVQPGDEIEVRESKKGHLRIAAALKIAATREECDWLEVDDKNLKGVFKSVPDRTDLSTMEWLQHLQEELMDACVYVEKLKTEMFLIQEKENGRDR